MANELRAILLCAGKGTRMNDDRTHKVCYDVAGVPVVCRLVHSLRQVGVQNFTVVVGHRAEDVINTLKNESGITFVRQETQSGTADAVLCALKSLTNEGYDGRILVCMGDKLFDPAVLHPLIKAHNEQKSDVSFLTLPKDFNPSGGRVILKNGKFYSLLEKMDEARLRLANLNDRSDTALTAAIASLGFNGKKADILLKIAKADRDTARRTLPAPQEALTTIDADAVTEVNAAFYLWESAKFAQDSLSSITNDNAQGEFYLTDAITLAARNNKLVTPIKASVPQSIQSYSTMEELMEIDRQYREKSASLRLASEWIDAFQSGKQDAKLFEIYGPHCNAIERRTPYLKALEAFIKEYGDRNVIISRAPGRVNLMGRHIEHRGGSTNILAIDREMVAVAAPRKDSTIQLANANLDFKKTSFSISDTIASYDTADWVEFIESEKILEIVSASRGDWSNYIKAGILRLQLNDRAHPLCGMDMMFTGNIPMAAGLSSSSALVVATMEAVIELNHLDVQVEEFVALSGEGEWFVGSRGGAGDHAAMKCGKRGQITHMNFFPFSVGESITWPEEYKIVVANSGIKAKKSGGARDKFNAMVTSYELAYLWVLKEFPEYKDRIHCLRDINAKNLGITESELYKLLLRVPLTVKTDEIYELYPEEHHKRIRRTLSSHNNFPEYRLRGVLLYGLSECARAKHCIELLKEQNYERLGELMCLSHNGDRVWQNGKPYQGEDSDEYLLGLIEDLQSGNPERIKSAKLYNQAGTYACSTREIDMLIDYIISREGVLGAQLSGAGLGGCVIALVKNDAVDKVIESLNQVYYKVRNLPPSANVFTPVAGSLVF